MSEPAPGHPDLEAQLRAASSGDEEAWRDIVEAYSPRVFALLRAQCGSADIAEEIAQSTFCTVAAKLDSYTELGKFEAWLFRIAMNRLRDEMRRRKRQAMSVEDESLAGMAGPTPEESGEPRADPAELAALRGAIGRLSDVEQTIIHLRHSADLSFKQIASMLDQPLGTVLARHHRALKKLREMIERDPGRE